MRRRDVIATLAGAAVAWPFIARAGEDPIPEIGFLGSTSPAPYAPFLAGFLRGLNQAGFVVTITYRWAEGKYDRLPDLARELVARNVSVIIATGGLPTSLAAKAATTTIPIVFTLSSDPVKFGVVASLNRPGGNITGVTLLAYKLDAKRVEMAHELVPRVAVIALLENPNSPQADTQSADVEAAARAIGQRLVPLKASSENDFEAAFATLVSEKAGALLVSADPFFLSKCDQLTMLAARHAVLAIYEWREFPDAGGLMSYGLTDAYRQAGDYAGRILSGAKPADLPVLQPAKFELVINLKTAKAMRLTVPQTLLLQAADVIE